MSAIVTSLVCRVVPILLVHGQPGRADDWRPLIAALRGHSDVLAVNRPGWDGHSAAGGFGRSAAAAREALDRAGWPCATVVGHSYGAAVAAWLAIEHPERVASLLLIAPSANSASLLLADRLLAVPGIEPIAGAAMSLGARRIASSRGVGAVAARALRVDQDWLRRAARPLAHPAAWRSFFVEQRLQIHELPALESRLGHVRAPTTIVAGGSDRIVPLYSARLLAAQIQGARLVVIPGGGHLLAAQHPHRLAAMLLQGSPSSAARQSDVRTPTGANTSRDSSRNACAAGG
jgi:pimeloyl-ACP methyl ester carboxylesterase